MLWLIGNDVNVVTDGVTDDANDVGLLPTSLARLLALLALSLTSCVLSPNTSGWLIIDSI